MNAQDPTLAVILMIVSMVIMVIVCRSIFKIDKRVKLMEYNKEALTAQVRLMKLMLIKQGVSAGEIDRVIKEGNK